MTRSTLTVARPAYRLSGHVWHEHDTPSAIALAYNQLLDACDPKRDSRAFPAHAHEPCRRYGDTLRDLVAAGF